MRQAEGLIVVELISVIRNCRAKSLNYPVGFCKLFDGNWLRRYRQLPLPLQ